MKKQFLLAIAAILIAMVTLRMAFPVIANSTNATITGTGIPGTTTNSDGTLPDGSWVIEAVDWRLSKYFSWVSDRVLRVDGAGNPHIAYGGPVLYYTWYDGMDWQYETVDDAEMVGYGASLDLDGEGNPSIVYRDLNNGTIKYATRDETGWHTGLMDPGGGDYPSLVLDQDGYGHVSYLNQGKLTYAYQDDSGWYTKTLDSQTTSGGWSGINSLDLDSEGYPHIGYYVNYYDPVEHKNYQTLRYAYQDATGWYTQTVDDSGNVGNHPSLVVDSQGKPHISYRDIDHQSLKYATLTQTGWYSVTVDNTASICYFTSIDLDNQDHPQVVYNSDDSTLRYASFDGEDWQTDIVPIDGNPACSSSSIAIAESEVVHLVYDDWVDGYLRYASYDDSEWQTTVIDSEVESLERGKFSSLALDLDGYPHIAYYDAKNESIKHIFKTPTGDWTYNSPNYGPAEVGEYTSLDIDGYGYAHISAYDATNENLVYAFQDSSGWNEMTLITSNVNDGLYTSLEVNNDGQAYISYWDQRFADLYFIFIDHGYYINNSQDSTGDVGKYSSIALDTQDQFHISYYDATNDNLKYVKQGYPKQVIDHVGNVALHSSIDTDGENNPHISYTGNSLLYAAFDGSEWYTETVDIVGQYSSIAVDNAGNPHISYYDEINGDLKYAHKAGGTWTIQVIDAKGNIGQYTSIALDQNGYPHISYYDVTYQGLKYATFKVEHACYLPLVVR